MSVKREQIKPKNAWINEIPNHDCFIVINHIIVHSSENPPFLLSPILINTVQYVASGFHNTFK